MLHLAASTLTALLLIVVMWALPRRPAQLRFAILLVALLRFAVPTGWLTLAGSQLAERVGTNSESRKMIAALNFPVLHPSTISFAFPLKRAARDYSTIIALIWVTGSAPIFGLWLWRAGRRMPRIRAANEFEMLALLNASRKFPELLEPELRIVDARQLPGALGIWRHQIVLPEGLSGQLNQAELESVCAHELAHFSRWDNLTAALASAVTAAFWFHPLVWWMERQMLAERELACDELVLVRGGEPQEYAVALSKVSKLAWTGGASYARITGPNLKQRLELIMSFPTRSGSHSSWRGFPATLAVIALIVPFSAAFVNAQPEHTDPRADAMYLEANLAYSKKDYSSAEKIFNQMKAQFPGDSRGLYGLAEMALVTQKPAEARAMLEANLATAKDAKDKRGITLALANVAVRTGDYAGAIQFYTPLAESEPNDADLQMRVGEVYLRKGDLANAQTYFNRARQLTPSDMVPLLKLGAIYERTGETAKALSIYETAVKVQPNNGIALNNLAYWQMELGVDRDQALSHALKAKLLLPDNADVSDTLGWIYLKVGRADDAVKEFREALLSSAEGDHADWRSHLAAALDQGGTLATDRSELQRLLAQNYSAETETKIKTLLKESSR